MLDRNSIVGVTDRNARDWITAKGEWQEQREGALRQRACSRCLSAPRACSNNQYDSPVCCDIKAIPRVAHFMLQQNVSAAGRQTIAQWPAALFATAMPVLLEPLASVFALVTRVYVSWVFLKSGYLKLASWDSTLALFEYEYRVPLLPPHAAALLGTAGELVFPMLLILGLCGRLSALGLFAVNALAVISYSHVLLQKGFEAAVAQHYLWGFMLLVLMIYGPGRVSLDRLIERKRAV